jgi:hypothetical protein
MYAILVTTTKEGNKMTYIETVEKLKILDKEAKALERSFDGDWKLRNLPENLDQANRLDSEIRKLNATIGYSFYNSELWAS